MSDDLATPAPRDAGADWIRRSLELLDSFERLLGRPLVDRDGTPAEQAGRLNEAPQVVVAHGVEDDPVLNYANRAAVALWGIELARLLRMPSRLTAEPVHRTERAEMLARTQRDGFIDDYRGVRITATGRRFLIDQAIVWNVTDADGSPAGQAATFSTWRWLEDARSVER